MTTLAGLIREPKCYPFRRAYIRRRNLSDGKYEADWHEITEYVKSFGNMNVAVDDVRLNRFTHSGISLKVRNDEGKFNHESKVSSLWNGYLTRYRTLVKIESGYLDKPTTGYTEYPTNTTMGIFIMNDEIPISAVTNEAVLQCRSIVSVFDEVQARDIVGLGPTQTASDLIAKIRDHTDGAGNAIFQQFISAGAWNIQTTTSYYNVATSTALDGLSAWEFMSKHAESEGFLLFVNREGELEFRNRLPRTTTAAHAFYGLGFPKPNVIALNDYTEALNKHYNYFRLKFDDGDTSTSYVTAGTATSVDPSNTSWIYGSRKYELENLFINSQSNAQTLVDGLYNEFGSELKEEVTLKAKFVPDLDISDRVTVSYRTYPINFADAALWDIGLWDVMFWADETGESIDWDAREFKILSMKTNLDNFTTEYRLREV